MAVEIVGSGSASTTGALTIVIPLHASTAIGDDVYLQINFRRAGGLYPTVTTPASYFLIATGTGFRLYQRLYTTTPPADVTITFSDSDTHAQGRSISVRGFQEDAGSSWRRLSALTDATVTTGAQALAERVTEFDGTMCLSFYVTQGALAMCAHRASIASATTNPTTIFTIVIPAATEPGDSLFCQVTSRDHTSGDAYPTVTDNDTGGNTWAKIAESTDRVATLWWKRATVTTASKTITVAGCIGSAAGGLSVYQNAAKLVTPYTNIAVESNASADETHAGFTPDHRGSAICLAVFNYGAANAVSSESTANLGAMTERWEKTSTGGNDSACVHASINGTDTAPAATGAITWAQTNGVTHSITWAVRPESITAASITVPAEQTGLFSATQAGPPDLGIAAGYQLIADTETVVPEQSLTLSSATLLNAVQLFIIPNGSVSVYEANWATPIGPYEWYDGEIIFDTVGNYAYYITDQRIAKFDRTSLAIVGERVETTFRLAFGYPIDQDDDYLYLAQDYHTFSPYTPILEAYIKVNKSNLTTAYTADQPPNPNQGPSGLKLGRPGTWSEGFVFATTFGDNSYGADNQYRLTVWDKATGNVTQDILLLEITAPAGSHEWQRSGYSSLTVDINGDIWILMSDGYMSWPLDFEFPTALVRINSSYSVNGPYALPGVYHNDNNHYPTLAYDEANHRILVPESANDYGAPVRKDSVVAAYDIGSGAVIWKKNYTLLYLMNAELTGHSVLRTLFGVPSIFTPWYPEYDGSGNIGLITQHNYETGDLIRVITLPAGYDMWIGPAVLSPEKKLWIVVKDQSVFNDEYILVLDTGASLPEFAAQGYISWAEMQVPDPTTGAAMVSPYVLSYGTRWGLSMGLSRDSLPDFLRDPKVEK